MGPRKYPGEFALNLTCSVQILGRQRELEQVDLPSEPSCHIYVISRKPRLSIDPRGVSFDDGVLSAIIRMQVKEKFRYFKLQCPFQSSLKNLSWHSEWPYENFELRDEDTGIVALEGSAAAFASSFKQCPREFSEHEVLYVGQAFGRSGERTAFDRIVSHSTLQRIYSEAAGDQDIMISLCAITDAKAMVSFNPNSPAVVDDTQDDEHTQQVLDWLLGPEFREKQGVALVEAGLIRYFKPAYNEIFKNNFPAREHVNLRELFEIEMNSLIVEFQGLPVGANFWSKSAESSMLHWAIYPLHSEVERKAFMSDLL